MDMHKNNKEILTTHPCKLRADSRRQEKMPTPKSSAEQRFSLWIVRKFVENFDASATGKFNSLSSI